MSFETIQNIIKCQFSQDDDRDDDDTDDDDRDDDDTDDDGANDSRTNQNIRSKYLIQ